MQEATAMLIAKTIAVVVDEAMTNVMAAVKNVIEATRDGA